MATDKELARVEGQNESLRRRLSTVNRAQKERGRRLQRKAATGIGAYLIGRYDLKEKASIGALDGLTVLGIAGTLAPEVLELDDELADIIDAVGDSALAIKGYEMGLSDSEETEEDTTAAAEESRRGP